MDGGEVDNREVDEVCTSRTGERLMEVLRTNQLEARTSTAASLDSYLDRPPELVRVINTYDTVTEFTGDSQSGLAREERTQSA